MKKKILIPIALFLAVCGKLSAQDDMQSSQIYANKLYYNPAATGFDDKFFISGAYRMQWAGSTNLAKEARPKYILLNATQFFYDKRSGVGVSIYDGRQNVDHTFQLKAAYAYHMQVQEEAWLSMGTSIGMLSKSVKNSITVEGSSVDNRMVMLSDWALGVEYYTPELCVGVSAQHIPIVLGEKDYRNHAHFYYYMIYYHQLDEDWRLMPSISLRNSAFITNFDVLMRASYLNKFQAGLGYRMDAFSLLIGMNIGETFALSYSFDISNKYLNKRGIRPSHEIMLSYRTQLIKKYNTLERLDTQKDF